jgi:hypothetical protein
MKIAKQPSMRPYPGRLEPRPGEPAYGLLLRTANHNGVLNAYTMFQRNGLQKGASVATLSTPHAAFVCRQRTSVLRQWTPRILPSKIEIGRETLFSDQFSAWRRRWCAECLREDPYHRVWWDISCVSACSIHRIKLTDHCGCKSAPLWRSCELVECRGGHNFTMTQQLPADEIDVALSGYIRGRLLEADYRPNPLLDPLEIGEAIRICERIGRASLVDAVAPQSRPKVIHRHQEVAEGFYILSDFESRFVNLLDRLVAASDSRASDRRWGVWRAYGRIYTWIAGYPSGSRFSEAIKHAVAIHAAKHVIVKTRHAIAGVKPVDLDTVDMQAAADLWQLRIDRFRRVASALDLIPETTMRGEPPRLDRAKIEYWADRLRLAKRRQTIASELGISSPEIGRLVKEGVLEALFGFALGIKDTMNSTHLPGDAAEILLARLAANAPLIRPDDADTVSLTSVARTSRAPLARLCRWALDGALKVVGQDSAAVGLHGILVSRSEATHAFKRFRVPGVTLEDAAKQLKIQPRTLTRFRIAGEITVTQHGRTCSIPQDDLDRIRLRYVSVMELVENHKLEGPRWAAAILRKMKVSPIFPREHFSQPLYSRQQATEAIRRWKALPPATKPIRPPGLDCKSTAALIDLEPALVSQLAANMQIRAVPKARGYIIDPADAEDFKNRYVTSAQLSCLTGGMNCNAVLAILKSAPVEPLCGPPDYLAYVFPRANAEAAIRRWLRNREGRQ